MTKKHFVALAEVLKQFSLDSHLNSAFKIGASKQINSDKAMSLLAAKDAAHRELTNILADYCQAQNGNFNRERWLAYIAGGAK